MAIITNIIGNGYFIKKAHNLCTRYSYDQSSLVSGIAQPWRENKGENRNIYEKEWFDVIETQFEDGFYYIPKGYDKILKMGYGDYMTPLPENERQTHHNYKAYLR